MPLIPGALFDMEKSLLRVRNLKTYFFTRAGTVKAVDGIDLDLLKSECLCLVGESGCGKTVTALSILGLIDSPPGRIVDGEIYYDNINLLKCPREQVRRIRGKDIAMIFQDAQSALNPVFTIGDQIVEQIKLHLGASNQEAKERAVGLLAEVGIPSPEEAADYYPHQLSGGMKKRVDVARVFANNPDVLLLDESFGSLDSQTKEHLQLELLNLWEQEKKTAIFVTHDIEEAIFLADRILVMRRNPGMIDQCIEVPFGRPRDLGIKVSPEFQKLRYEMHTVIAKL